MAQALEYGLVVLVSSLFTAGTIATYNSFSSFESGLQVRADLTSISGLVDRAIGSGDSSGSISLPSSTVRCQGGSLILTSASFSDRLTIPVGCDFSYAIEGGTHEFVFSVRSSRLLLTVN